MGLLGGLQIITCIWMYLISKVAYKVVIGVGAEDVRSDEDDTDFEKEGEEDKTGVFEENEGELYGDAYGDYEDEEDEKEIELDINDTTDIVIDVESEVSVYEMEEKEDVS